jgi:hypothetical protein
MTIHIPSLILGSILTYALSAVVLVLMCAFDQRRERKVRDKALDQLVAGVAIRCIKIDVRKN